MSKDLGKFLCIAEPRPWFVSVLTLLFIIMAFDCCFRWESFSSSCQFLPYTLGLVDWIIGSSEVLDTYIFGLRSLVLGDFLSVVFLPHDSYKGHCPTSFVADWTSMSNK